MDNKYIKKRNAADQDFITKEAKRIIQEKKRAEKEKNNAKVEK